MIKHAMIEDRVKDGTHIFIEDDESEWAFMKMESLLSAISFLNKRGFRLASSCGGDVIQRLFFIKELSK